MIFSSDINMKYNLFRGLWKKWEETLEPSFFLWMQKLEDLLSGLLRNGLTFEDQMKGRFLELVQQPTNVDLSFPNFLSPLEMDRLSGVWTFQASEHGTLTWHLADDTLHVNFASLAPTVNLKLFCSFK